MKKLFLLIFIICNLIGCQTIQNTPHFDDVEEYSAIHYEIIDNN